MNVFKELDKPIVYKLPEVSSSIFNKKVNPTFSRNIDYPSFTLGFQHYIHANKDKFDILEQFKNKKKVYMVLNKLNKDIDEYEKDLSHSAKNMCSKNLTQEFFEYWELLSCFDILNKSVFLSKQDSCIEECFIEYQKKFGNKIEVNIKPKSSSLVVVSYKNGNYNYRNTIEQDSMTNLLSEIELGLLNLEEKGNMIIKVNEIYTNTSVKLIYALSECFKKSYLYKPLTSAQSDSEKFIVLINFNKHQKELIKLIKEINKIPNGNYLVDFCKEFSLSKEFITIYRKFNTDFSNRQLMDVNKIVEFIKSENYYGETYQNYRDVQINYTTKWIDKYFTNIVKNRQLIISDMDKLSKLFNETAQKVETKILKTI